MVLLRTIEYRSRILTTTDETIDEFLNQINQLTLRLRDDIDPPVLDPPLGWMLPPLGCGLYGLWTNSGLIPTRGYA
ncbi:hypothetical protein EVAR_39916_1 [Eumeta japonica]|uniref:Uncharacterized protein n=1 Tax=Eumeta variegata TaxID=151549 RepID=A0A4C1WQT2_EUMVA|nr:hypothetical protein EVAR_39916_1 [Eumeta japonica]